jgi:hypothetical protein
MIEKDKFNRQVYVRETTHDKLIICNVETGINMSRLVDDAVNEYITKKGWIK